MKRFILAALLAAGVFTLSFPALGASQVITGTLTITNAAPLTGTNGYTITVSGNTRTWTNTVHTPATQILASTNIATAVQSALVSYATYPISGLSLISDGATYLAWRGSAVTVTLSTNIWGSVSYATNTVYAGTPVKINYTEAALAAASAVTNFIPDFEGADYQTITAAGAVHLLQTTNRPGLGGRAIVLRILPNGTNRSISFGPTWFWTTDRPATITNGTIQLISFFAGDSVETNVTVAATWAAPQ